MKKLLALFLALLLLPAAALAEAISYELTIAADEANMTAVLTASGAYDDDMASAIAALLNGTSLKVIAQENGGSLALTVAGTPLLDATVLADEMDMTLTSTLAEGYAITLPIEVVELMGEVLTPAAQQVDWLALLEEALAAASIQAEGIAVTSVRGSFSGHAYTGGVYCDTYTFDDAQIAAILSALLTDELSIHLQEAASLLGLNGVELLLQIAQKHEQVAADNAYRYIVRVVYDARREPIGASAVVLQGDSQLGTLSIGMQEDTLQIVLGIGMDDANFWHSHEITFAAPTDADGTEHLQYSGFIQEFTAPKEDDYAYAMAASGVDQLRAAWSLDLAAKDDAITWSLNHQERRGTSTAIHIVDWTGDCTPGQQLHSTWTASQNGKQYLTITLNGQPCEPIAADFNGLTMCNILADDGLLNEMAYAAGMELAMRLVQALPAQLLMLLQ